MGGLRALPLVVAAALAVLTLKVIGMASGEGWALRLDTPAVAQVTPDPAYRPVAWAHERMAKAETAETMADPVITGSAPPKKKEESAPEPIAPEAPPSNVLQDSDSGERSTPGERAVLERLTDRRKELEDKAQEIEMRDSLLQAAEKRIEARIKELETIEARIAATKEGEGEGTEGQGAKPRANGVPSEKLKDLVTMYENMKPKDAAKIFDELNLRVLVDVVKQMNPRKMGDVLAKMKPEAAQRLTVELASYGRKPAAAVPMPQALPQIQGIPTQP